MNEWIRLHWITQMKVIFQGLISCIMAANHCFYSNYWNKQHIMQVTTKHFHLVDAFCFIGRFWSRHILKVLLTSLMNYKCSRKHSCYYYICIISFLLLSFMVFTLALYLYITNAATCLCVLIISNASQLAQIVKHFFFQLYVLIVRVSN